MVSWPSGYSAWPQMSVKFLSGVRVPPGALIHYSLEYYSKMKKEVLQVRFEHTISRLVVAVLAKASC